MKNNLLYFGLVAIFIASFLFPNCDNLTLKINNGAYNISYNSSSCNLLNSSTVSNDLKCLMLCQMTVCKYLIYDVTTNRCILNGSQPGLIKYANLTSLNIVYNLGIQKLFKLITIITILFNLYLLLFITDTYLSFGQSCLFGFTCNGSVCLNGTCTCMRNLTA